MDRIQTYKYGVNVGVQAAIGVQFVISGNFRGFGELFGYYLPITPTSSNLSTTTRTYDASNKLTNVSSPPSTDFTYSNSGTSPSSNNVQPSTTYNANSLGINIGIAYRF